MLVRVAYEGGTDLVVVAMESLECKSKEVYSITQLEILADNQKLNLHNIVRERYLAIMFVINSNHNKYG